MWSPIVNSVYVNEEEDKRDSGFARYHSSLKFLMEYMERDY